jgi:hypothetical protein
METKLLLTLPILAWIVIQDIRHREINDRSWIALVVLGVVGFIYEIILNPSGGVAAMFAVSLLGGMAVGLFFYEVGIQFPKHFDFGGGDTLVLIGLSTVTYNMVPFPMFIPILLIASGIGLFFSLLLPKVQGRYSDEVDVPFTLHLATGFLVVTYIF